MRSCEQSREQLENLKAQIDADVRTALLNLQSSAEQVAVAKSNIDLARANARPIARPVAAGVTDTVEVVQAQEASGERQRELHLTASIASTTQRFPWLALWAWPKQSVKEYFKGK